MSLALTSHDKDTLRTAAYGAVALLAAADAAGAPGKVASRGAIALACATGPVGHVLAERAKVVGLRGKSVAELADRVLPCLTDAMALLRERDPALADDFRGIVDLAVESATLASKGRSGPVLAAMARQIASALDAAPAPATPSA
ncbi:hypothetical protein AB0M28_04745 [Streptomyces sp. NPDC051940]|uniref:hypothetical protein n=1 Tax=Streptomyces sp. NPDC051940 TaxID=3155675 RepID=UPI00343A5473